MGRDFELILEDANDENARFLLKNERNEKGLPQVQRPYITGYDRQGDAARMAINGRLATTVHGFERRGSDIPYTLVIFEWFIVRRRLDKRFRELTIEVHFTAHGDRGGAEPAAARRRRDGGRQSHWDPEVCALAPASTAWYHRTTKEVEEKHSAEVNLSAGYAPFFSAGPKYAWERTDKVARGDAMQVAGDLAFMGEARHRAEPNGARWTLLENASQHSGVPAYFRTAVLLRRRRRDDGQFLGHVSLRYRISPFVDFKETLLNALGVLPRDDPLIFDPKEPNSPSPFEPADLAAVDLSKEHRLLSVADTADDEPVEGSTDAAVGSAEQSMTA